ncbi:MAG: PEP-utilizing enzyme [Desulforhopalus sp.]
MNKIKIVATLGPGTDSKDQIVGRELGIPVVCNVLDDMTMLDNELTVTIDGTTGHISYGNSSSI